MRVPAFADAPESDRAASCGAPRAGRSTRLGEGEVARVGDLEVLAPTRHQQRRRPDRLDRARLVGRPRAGALPARRRAAPRRNICGVCACQTSSRGSVAATPPFALALERVGDRQREQAADRIVARRRRSARSIHSGRTRQRAASCTSTQSSAPAPQLRQLGEARRPRSRRASSPPQRATARRSPAGRSTRRSNSLVVGREHDQRSGLQPRPRAASAASVCATIGAAGDLDVLLRHRRCRRGCRCRRRARAQSSGGGRRARSASAGDTRRARKHKPRRAPRPPKIATLCSHAPHSAAFMQLPDIAPGKRFALPRPTGSADALLLARFADASSARAAKRRRDLHRRAGRRAAPGRRDRRSSRRSCASPSSPTGRRCPTTPSRRTRT